MSGRALHRLLEASAEADPDRLAVVDRERTLTYGELERRANALARLLRERGVRRGDRVGLFLDKSLESLVGIYGALKAGAGYVPFDANAPPARLAYIAGDAGIRCLLTASAKSEGADELVAAGAPLDTLVALDAAPGEAPPAPLGAEALALGDALASWPDAPPADAGVRESDLAYILYTSGSTGEPKGVVLSHANALGFVDWAASTFDVRAGDRLSSHAPLHFDLSILDLFVAAHAGAPVVLVPPELSVFPAGLARFVADAEISIWYSVPSILTLLVRSGSLEQLDFPALRCVLFAGEVLPMKYLRALLELLPDARFSNLYGPTETNVCTWYEVPRPPPLPDAIPIGRAIDHVEVFAVREDGPIAAPGEVGELCVRGPTVMQGYWGDPERTRAAFLSDPPAYRTGDLVRQDTDGDFWYLGRRDAQIKSRGYRIELGDIESALYAHPSVVECAATPIPDEVVGNRIKAYVVVRDEVSAADLSSFCAQRIPPYMVPESFDFWPELPKTSTGKVDRARLRASHA